jgi:hypothetical protein
VYASGVTLSSDVLLESVEVDEEFSLADIEDCLVFVPNVDGCQPCLLWRLPSMYGITERFMVSVQLAYMPLFAIDGCQWL